MVAFTYQTISQCHVTSCLTQLHITVPMLCDRVACVLQTYRPSPLLTPPLTLFCTLHNHYTLHIESHTTTTLKDCHQFSTMSTHGIYVPRSPRDLEIASTTQIKTRYKYNELILSLTLLPLSLPPSPQALRHSE